MSKKLLNGAVLCICGTILPLAYACSGEFIQQTSEVIADSGGVSFQMKLSAAIVFLIGTMKLSVFRPVWDMLGRYKALAAPGLSLIAGVLMLPRISIQGLTAYLISGAGAIVLHELLDAIKAMPGISKAWTAWIDLVSQFLYRKDREQNQKKELLEMTDMLTAFFNAITQGLMLVNKAKATEYQHKFTEAQLSIKEEERKGDDADDAKIEALYGSLSVLAQAAQNEFKNAAQSRGLPDDVMLNDEPGPVS